MPTGYTADIKDGISFKTFAMNCARAFGACITLRDESGGGDAIPEELKSSQYNAEREVEARAELAALDEMSSEAKERAAAKAYDDAETHRVMKIQEHRDLRAKYEAMLAQASNWTPPTEDHRGLHEFMQQQIRESIAWDCDETYHQRPTASVSGSEWAEQRRAQLTQDIRYHEAQQRAENERTAQRNGWIKALRESLRE
jgi:hypothetical protein